MKILLSLLVGLVVFAGCKKKDDVVGVPTVSNIMFSAIGGASFTVTWSQGADDKTAAADLQYKVVYANGTSISSVADAEANGTVAMDWTAATLTKVIASLTDSTSYTVAVLVKDTDGNIGYAAGTTSTLCSGKVIYLATVTDGNLGGKAGADTICNAQKPASLSAATVKAMLSQGSSRAACYSAGNDNCGIIAAMGKADWPLAVSTNYCIIDKSKKVGRTNSAGLLSVDNVGALSSSATVTYTALNVAWGSTASNCTNWSSTSGSVVTGSADGQTGGSNSFIASSASTSCATAGTIYCIEQ